nr:reverse transcriptase domain-containing protein [Tanacetum cinerariifolium]
MSSPNHPNTDVKDSFSTNFPDYTTASPNYFPASPGNISPDPPNNLSNYLLASLAISPFHDMQAYNVVANKPPNLLQDLVIPPNILTPSLVLPPSLLFNPRYFFVPEELLPHKKQIHTPSSSSTMLSNSSRKQAFINLIGSFIFNSKLEYSPHNFENTMPPKRTSTSVALAINQAAIRQIIDDHVAAALEAQAANMPNVDNTNRNPKPRETPTPRKFKKMEDEFYNLVVKGNDLKTYARRFQELAVLCPNMVPNTEKLMKVFTGGLPRSIEGNVTASKPQTLEEAINITQRLMDQVTKHNSVQRTNDHKLKFDDRRNTNNNNYPNDRDNENHYHNRKNNTYQNNCDNNYNNRKNDHHQQ